jgi:hypothetical protein
MRKFAPNSAGEGSFQRSAFSYQQFIRETLFFAMVGKKPSEAALTPPPHPKSGGPARRVIFACCFEETHGHSIATRKPTSCISSLRAT